MKRLLLLKKSHIVVNLLSIVIFYILLDLIFASGALPDGDALGMALIKVCCSVILVTSLNIVAGSMGEVVLGHAGFMAIGAYVSGILTKTVFTSGSGVFNLIISMVIGALAAGFVGFLVGLPVLRLRGDYLAIVTLGFGEIVRNIVKNLNITGGAMGLTSIPVNTTVWIALLVAIVSVALMWLFMTGRHGRVILAIRDDEIASEASGVNVTRYKVLAFVISAFFAGIGGALFAQALSVIEPKNFNTDVSVDFLVMVVFGGMGSYTGGCIAAIFLEFIKYFLMDLAQYRMIVYGVVLIVIMIFRPGGLLGIREISITNILLYFCDFKLHLKQQKERRLLQKKNRYLQKRERLSSMYEAKKYALELNHETGEPMLTCESKYFKQVMLVDTKIDLIDYELANLSPIVRQMELKSKIYELESEEEARNKAIARYELKKEQLIKKNVKNLAEKLADLDQKITKNQAKIPCLRDEINAKKDAFNEQAPMVDKMIREKKISDLEFKIYKARRCICLMEEKRKKNYSYQISKNQLLMDNLKENKEENAYLILEEKNKSLQEKMEQNEVKKSFYYQYKTKKISSYEKRLVDEKNRLFAEEETGGESLGN